MNRLIWNYLACSKHKLRFCQTEQSLETSEAALVRNLSWFLGEGLGRNVFISLFIVHSTSLPDISGMTTDRFCLRRISNSPRTIWKGYCSNWRQRVLLWKNSIKIWSKGQTHCHFFSRTFSTMISARNIGRHNTVYERVGVQQPTNVVFTIPYWDVGTYNKQGLFSVCPFKGILFMRV